MRRRLALLALAATALAVVSCAGPGTTTERQPGTISAERRDVQPSRLTVTIRPPEEGER